MKLDKIKKLKIYELFIDRVEEITEIKYEFSRDEKQELLKTFTRISEAMDKTTEDEFEEVFVEYNNYIVNSIKKWKNWDKKELNNLIGFVTSRKASSMFILDTKNKYQKTVEDLDIAGVRDNDGW